MLEAGDRLPDLAGLVGTLGGWVERVASVD